MPGKFLWLSYLRNYKAKTGHLLRYYHSYAATRIFVSSKPIVAQRFIEMVILERVRDDIHETRKLNVHLFNSLKKSAPSISLRQYMY